jgi:hypothetical protein
MPRYTKKERKQRGISHPQPEAPSRETERWAAVIAAWQRSRIMIVDDDYSHRPRQELKYATLYRDREEETKRKRKGIEHMI